MTADGKFDVTTDAAKTAFNELATMVTEDKVTDLEGLTGGADMEGYQQLYAGRNMIVPRGPWTISEGEQSFGLKLGTDAAVWKQSEICFGKRMVAGGKFQL